MPSTKPARRSTSSAIFLTPLTHAAVGQARAQVLGGAVEARDARGQGAQALRAPTVDVVHRALELDHPRVDRLQRLVDHRLAGVELSGADGALALEHRLGATDDLLDGPAHLGVALGPLVGEQAELTVEHLVDGRVDDRLHRVDCVDCVDCVALRPACRVRRRASRWGRPAGAARRASTAPNAAATNPATMATNTRVMVVPVMGDLPVSGDVLTITWGCDNAVTWPDTASGAVGAVTGAAQERRRSDMRAQGTRSAAEGRRHRGVGLVAMVRA